MRCKPAGRNARWRIDVNENGGVLGREAVRGASGANVVRVTCEIDLRIAALDEDNLGESGGFHSGITEWKQIVRQNELFRMPVCPVMISCCESN